MCGRFAMPWDPDELADRLGVNTNEDARSVAPSYNIAPDATIAVIRRTADGGSLLAAGLLSIWRGMPTCSILTRRAEGRCAEIHDRMPVVIPPSRVQPWFDSGTDAQTALRGADRDGGGAVRLLASHPVAPLRGDGPRLIEPVVSAPRQGMLFD